MVVISLTHNNGEFLARGEYFVGSKQRHRSEAGESRSSALHRCLSAFRRAGHGGKPYRVMGEVEMTGVVPKPKPKRRHQL